MRHQLAGKVVGQNCDEKEGANDERTGNSVCEGLSLSGLESTDYRRTDHNGRDHACESW
jgi:hypothetical protein